MENLTAVKTTPQDRNIAALIARQNGSLLVSKNLKAVMYVMERNGVERPYMKIWRGRQQNPFSAYRYITMENMYERWNKAISDEAEITEWKDKRKAEKKALIQTTKANIKIGDIYYTSYGYSMTLVSFYEVVEINGSKITFKKNDTTSTGHGEGLLSAIPGKFNRDETYTSQVRSMKIDGQGLKKWNGSGVYYSTWD